MEFGLFNITASYNDVQLDADFWWLITLLIFSTLWVIYILFYHSRLFGLILTKVVNNIIIPRYLFPNKKRCDQPYLKIGSFSITFISGKLMFRDLIFVTPDYSIRILDGWVIFRWWIPFEPKDIRTNDFSHSDARLSLFLNGYELHIYNRSELYGNLEKTFEIFPTKLYNQDNHTGKSPLYSGKKVIENSQLIKAYLWRSFFPLTKIEISSGRFVFGNHLSPSTLLITFEEAHISYTSRPAVSPHDLFTHIAKAKAESFKVILAPSPKYLGLIDEPPRFMGEGFVVLQTNSIDLYYYQDEPGAYSPNAEKIELPTGDIVERFTFPAWGLDIKCGKGTDFSYGPWADRHRDLLYRFFYPPDYQIAEATPKPKLGELRQFETFYIRLSTLANAAVDILFTTKEKETKALHVNAGPGSYLEISLPWTTKEDGYHSQVLGQILHLDATTNLAFRSLAESETLEFNVKIMYPSIWNDHQIWTCSLNGCKATVQLIYAHKTFFHELIEDWAGKDRPDILQFVPYTWKFNIILKDFELILLANDYNWIDCSSKMNNENAQLAICGDLFDMSFDLPFDEFLPFKIPIKIWIQGESVFASFYLPESNPHRDNIDMLYKFSKLCPLLSNSNVVAERSYAKTSEIFKPTKKRRSVNKENGWIDCWSVPIVALSLTYTYHPVPPKTNSPKDSEITTPEREELLLEPIRPKSVSICNERSMIPPDFDPSSLDPDLIQLELEVGPSNLCLYGALFRMLWNIKENYIGECQDFYEFSSDPNLNDLGEANKEKNANLHPKDFDSRLYRPLNVTVSITLHDIQGHLMKSVNDDPSDPPCPFLYLERLCFEMDKSYHETKLQLILSPIILQSFDDESSFKSGVLIMDSLQFRGHAMFSGCDRPLDSETLEYAWLVQVQIGKICGRLSFPQLHQILTGLETFYLQVAQEDCSLQPPVPCQKCLHNLVQSVCPKTLENKEGKTCPYSENLKYKMVRVSLASIDVHLVELNTVVALQISSIRFSTCNLHSCHTSLGITALIKKINLRHFMKINNSLNSFKSSKMHLSSTDNNNNDATFYEVAKLDFGPIFVDSAELLSIVDNLTLNQNEFLRIHDEKTKRLWFLWPNVEKLRKTYGRCGCVGGCRFYGNNSQGIDFFSLESSVNSTSDDPICGESLLNPGEPVLGFELKANKNEEGDNLESIYIEKQINSPLSPTNKDFIPDDESQSKASLVNVFTKQATSPMRNFQISNTNSVITETSSPSSVLQSNSKTNYDLHIKERDRSYSENDESECMTASSLPKSTSRKVEFEKASKTSSLQQLSSYSLLEPYYSADEALNSDSESQTLFTATSNMPMNATSNDTFKSIQSLNTMTSGLSMPEKISIQATLSKEHTLSSSSLPLCANDKEEKEDLRSLSSASFLSAISSQEELVDLRNQMEKPIIESPLLMSSYTNHLTKFTCKNYSLNQSPQERLALSSWKKFIPQFHKTNSNGLSFLKLSDKECELNLIRRSFQKRKPFIPGSVFGKINEKIKIEKDMEESSENSEPNKARLEKQVSKTIEFRSEKITILVKFEGDINLRISPLSLDGCNTFIESLTHTLRSLHPLTIVNHLNLKCFSKVASKNSLKKEKVLEFGQLKLKAWKSTLERDKVLQKTSTTTSTGLTRTKIGDAINDVRAHLKPAPVQSNITTNVFEENKSSKFQAFIQISKINIIVLQASLVEEFIAFSALDNIKDLTCVSLFSICIAETNFDFCCSSKERRSLHTIISNNIQTQPTSAFAQFAQSDIVSRLLFKKPKKEKAEVEPVTIETHELLEEELIGVGAITLFHGQLSRLRNSSSILKEAILTVVPQNHSKVRFKYDKCSRPRRKISGRGSLTRQDCIEDEKRDLELDALLSGFIMFEFGFEEISIKAVKKRETHIVGDDDKEDKKDEKKDKKSSKRDKDRRRASSFAGEIGIIWFNFAAPPKTPNTRKIDFTRLDWHFLSTATPSINAWLSVGDRFIMALKRITHLQNERILSVVSYLMISALEVDGIHISPSSKYFIRKITPFSKALQEDPSCQLMSVLRRFLNRHFSGKEMDKNTQPNVLPSLHALRRGVIALSRQWKNALYMPLLVEQNIRLTRGERNASSIYQSSIPLRVLFENKNQVEEIPMPVVHVPSETGDEMEPDEKTNLLSSKVSKDSQSDAKEFSRDHSREERVLNSKKYRTSSQPEIVISGNRSQDDNGKRKLSTLPTIFPRSSRRGSVAFPLLSNPLESLGSGVNKAYGFLFSPNSGSNLKTKRNESQQSLKSVTSTISSIDGNNFSIEPIFTSRAQEEENCHDESLYLWMARQQDYMEAKNLNQHQRKTSCTRGPDIYQSRCCTLGSMNSHDEDINQMVEIPPGFVFVPTGVQLGNVRIIFEPLFFSLGVENLTEEGETNIAFDQLGPKISVTGSIKMFKVDIVESEPIARKDMNTELKLEASAFVCDQLNVDLELRKVKDFKSDEAKASDTVEESNETDQDDKVPIVIVGPDGDIKEITTIVNFNINIRNMVQRVNLPLLRLLHQVASMYENAKETRLELKANRILPSEEPSRNVDKQLIRCISSGREEWVTKETREENKAVSINFTPQSKDTVINIEDEDSLVSISTEMHQEEVKPKCWKTMYYLLDLYETTPETKTITERVSNVPIIETKMIMEEEENKRKGGYEQLKEDMYDAEELSTPTTALRKISFEGLANRKPMVNIVSSDKLKTYTQALIHRELTPLKIFGVVKIEQVKLVAMLGGLKLDGELSTFHVSLTHKEKVRGAAAQFKKWKDSSLTGQLEKSTISLLEEFPLNQQLVVKMMIGKSQTLLSSQNKKGKDANSALLSIGPIMIDIPQHPVALHGMMTRSSKQLSTTLQELRSSRQTSRSSRQMDDVTNSYQMPQETPNEDFVDTRKKTSETSKPIGEKLIKPILFHFGLTFDSFTVQASLLPSLRAQYCIRQITSNGLMGSKAKFVVDVREHTLSFNTNLPVQSTESTLPSSASVSLPLIHVSAEYMEDNDTRSETFADGIVLRRGSYLNALADIGSFEHSLTTDLLNHLLLVQKVFMKEVNEVVQKMSGYDSKLLDPRNYEKETLNSSNSSGSQKKRRYLLFSLHLRLGGIQITATTPTNSAVRLETGSMELQLSNRVQNMSSTFRGSNVINSKMFIKLQVDLNVALGQLIRNALFDEAEPEFQQLAYFKTRIAMRNSLQDELVSSSTSSSEDKEAVLITLKRPLVYIQPLALDKAVLVWLNYKNAYEYWNEQRASLNKEVVNVTQQVFEKVQTVTQMGTQTLSTLFLQLTIDDLGICLPITNPPPFGHGPVHNKIYDSELKSALVITLESTRISACSCGSLVSKAGFTGLCFRFADDFETCLDDWKPDPSDSTVMNLCIVSEGTYEICSKTITHSNASYSSDAKWVLNVSWKMEGFDIHVDTSIGKQFSALFKTLTAIAGEESESIIDYSSGDTDELVENQDDAAVTSSSADDENVQRRPSLFKDQIIDNKKRSRLIENQLNEQANIINDLRQLGASQSTIDQEIKRLHELESVVFNDFKRDMIKKLRRQSLKRPSFREKMKMDYADSIAESSSPNDQRIEDDMSEKNVLQTHDEWIGNGLNSKQSRSISMELSKTHPKSSVYSSSEEFKSENQTSFSRLASTKLMSLSTPPPSLDIPKSISDSTTTSSRESISSLSSAQVLTDTSESSKMNPTEPESSLSSTNIKQPDFKIEKASDTLSSSSGEKQEDKIKSKTLEFENRSISSPRSKSITHQLQEPNIDFELDVKIFFNSGKCVFHTRDPKEKDEEYQRKNGLPKERSFTGSEGLSSPIHQSSRSTNLRSSSNKQQINTLKTNLSSSRLRYLSSGPSCNQYQEFTNVLIPGLDIKVHYNSKTIFPSQQGLKVLPETNRIDEGHLVVKRSGVKKASCYAWMTLHSIPEETIITPHILDFMEQALEPIPIEVSSSKTILEHQPSGGSEFDRPDLITSAPAQYAVYASFPVDVIVYLHMQPSVLRFSCLPVSRVECLLQLPSVDLVFSSKRLQDELDLNFHQGSPVPTAKFKYGHKRVGSELRGTQTETSIGGLSMTGCLADFSLYIFHPYGGQKKSSPSITSLSSPPSRINSDRKDSLSLQVEFVKINISRSRKLVVSLENLHKNPHDLANQTVVIRFSAFCDIGSASFKYDMRRLTEILAFPKAWYRKALWKRVFLGDHGISTRNLFSDADDLREENLSSSSSGSSLAEDSELNIPKGSMNSMFQERMTKRNSLWLQDIPNHNKLKVFNKDRSKLASSLSSSVTYQRQIMSVPWKTSILFGVNLSKLNVHMNVGNVMGNTSWLTRDFRSEGRISIDSSGDKCFNVGLGCDGSVLDAKGGIVGGSIELSKILTKVNVKENYGKEPNHVITMKLDTFEKRLDYMSTPILMLRVSDLGLTLRDEWQIDAEASNTSNHPTKRAALIFIHCNVSWDQLQVLMSRSTTPDIVKIIGKLEEFFSQQFHSSKRVFSSAPISTPPSTTSKLNYKERKEKGLTRKQSDSQVGENGDGRYRHWQKVLRMVSGASLFTLKNPLPDQGTILGGTFELNGNNISLACFHVNFRSSKSWGLFSMRQPNISFASEAQDVYNEIGKSYDTHIIQNFNFSLGRRGRRKWTEKETTNEVPFSVDCFHAQHSHMARVCRISRTVTFPPQFKTMHEWFQYAFASSEIDQINRFPYIEFDRSSDGFSYNTSEPRRVSMSPKSSECDHSCEVIFAFPSFQMDLKTEHLQNDNPHPSIDCTFVTDFDDHIFVAVDAEAYYFLHELITSYIKEKQSNLPVQKDGLEKEDFREYNCQTWILEPTVRLITWAGKNLEPYGVDYILQKLGFSQARVTIPKWIQRGAMDPLDQLLSSLMSNIIHAIKNNQDVLTKPSPIL